MPGDRRAKQHGKIAKAASELLSTDVAVSQSFGTDKASCNRSIVQRSLWWRVAMATLLGLGTGWLIGVLWWTVLAILLGPSTEYWQNSTGSHYRRITVLENVSAAPLTAIPWAVVGGLVGLFSSLVGDYLPVQLALCGMVVAGIYVVVTSMLDGWLSFTMPFFCFGGTIAGLLLGLTISLIRQEL